MSADDALFVPDGDRFVPTDLTRGPWTREAQHGGPPAALLAREVERVPGGDGMLVARLTIELLRPVPVVPLAVSARLVRPGRKVQLVEASMRAGDVEVARATALRIRTADLPVPAERAQPPAPPPPESGSASLPPWGEAVAYRSFHRDGVEHRFVAGSFAEPGPATDWIRLRVPVVAGEPVLPLSRVVAAADFGNGISWTLSRVDGWEFINPDLTVYLHRHPAGEWVCLESRTSVESHGVGLAESRLWDRQGPLGSSLQSLLLDRH
ncbi:MAG TPA: thioesterase family protein [Candidatus Limnocylindria bacterium]|nr:thioesterase family protein [Candidatus Limnocylindria bacterium]